MFVRQRMHKSKGDSYRGGTTRVRAILVEAVRIDGKPRQQHVAVLASFIEGRLDVEVRREFWKAAEERLTIYVHDDDRSRIEATLARRVPPLTSEEAEANDRQRKEARQQTNDIAISIGRPDLVWDN
jgi:hypothetical protein